MLNKKTLLSLLSILILIACQPVKNSIDKKLTGSWELERYVNSNPKIQNQKTYKRIDFLENGTYKLTRQHSDIVFDEKGDYRVLDDLKINDYVGALILMPPSGIMMSGDTVDRFINYKILTLDRESLVIEQSFGFSNDSAQAVQFKRKEFFKRVSEDSK